MDVKRNEGQNERKGLVPTALRTRWMLFSRIPPFQAFQDYVPSTYFRASQDPEQEAMGQVGWRQVGGSLYGPAGQEALFLLPALPRKVFRGCPSTHQDPPSPSGHGLGSQCSVRCWCYRGRGSTAGWSRGTCHPAHLQSSCRAPQGRPPGGRSRAWPWDLLAFRVSWEIRLMGRERLSSQHWQGSEGLALRVCILCPACFTPRVLAWLYTTPPAPPTHPSGSGFW